MTDHRAPTPTGCSGHALGRPDISSGAGSAQSNTILNCFPTRPRSGSIVRLGGHLEATNIIHEPVGIITSILLLLVVARLLGELASRIGQSPVVGEIFSGIILGPTVLKIVLPSRELAGIAELSVFLILFSAGLEMAFSDVIRAFLGRTAILGIASFILPLGTGLLLGLIFGQGVIPSVILGFVFGITALPVILRILSNMKQLNSEVARHSIATAILNDIAALFCLGVVLRLPRSEVNFRDFLWLVSQTGGKLVLFAGIVFSLSVVFQWAGSRHGLIEGSLKKIITVFGKESLFGVVILFALAIGALGEALSSHFVIGVFFGGLLISREAIGEELFSSIEMTLQSITTGFLSPVFFAYIGLNFSLGPLESFRGILFAVAVILGSIGAKTFASKITSRWTGMGEFNAIGVGILLNSRGTMDLVVADIALTRGFIDTTLFSTLVLLSVTSTIITPILFAKLVRGQKAATTKQPPAETPPASLVDPATNGKSVEKS